MITSQGLIECMYLYQVIHHWPAWNVGHICGHQSYSYWTIQHCPWLAPVMPSCQMQSSHSLCCLALWHCQAHTASTGLTQPYIFPSHTTCAGLSHLCSFSQCSLTHPYIFQPYNTGTSLPHLCISAQHGLTEPYVVRPYNTCPNLSCLCIYLQCGVSQSE